MKKGTKVSLITLASIVIAAASFTYGALTATRPTPTPTPTPKPIPKASVYQKPTMAQLNDQLTKDYPTIVQVLTTAYPKIATDYTVNRGRLFDTGQWYGTTLQYHGTDALNRDTLRVLLQKKNGVWKLRTTPPQPLLSAVSLPDVPKDILKAINQPVSLP